MCTDLSRFYTFVDGTFVEFYPKHRVVEKFFLATEEIHRFLELETITNADLRKVVDHISVNRDGNVRIVLKKMDNLEKL